jgi:hypothetical protein
MDPRFTIARFPSRCQKCGAHLNKGEGIFYYPRTRTVLCCRQDACGPAAGRRFQAEIDDERMYHAH